jgi:hypothetical protein
VANFLLALLSSEIGDLSEWFSNLGTNKILKGQDLESTEVGGRQSSRASQKFTDEDRRVSRCFVVVQNPGLVSPHLRPLPSLCLHETLHDLQVKHSSDCLTTWDKLMINDALPIKEVQQHLHL